MRRQDPGVPHEPRVRLRVLLVLMRIVAGRRGWAQVSWHGAGFGYVLYAQRDPDVLDGDVDLDDDVANDDPDVARHRARLVELLRVQP